MFKNSGCVDLFLAVKDRAAKGWDGAGLGTWSCVKLPSEMKQLRVLCAWAEQPACFQLCFSEGEEERCRVTYFLLNFCCRLIYCFAFQS